MKKPKRETLADTIAKIVRQVGAVNSTVHVVQMALNEGGDTDLELRSGDVLRKAGEELDEAYSALLMLPREKLEAIDEVRS